MSEPGGGDFNDTANTQLGLQQHAFKAWTNTAELLRHQPQLGNQIIRATPMNTQLPDGTAKMTATTTEQRDKVRPHALLPTRAPEVHFLSYGGCVLYA
jgi:hypothetical protein